MNICNDNKHIFKFEKLRISTLNGVSFYYAQSKCVYCDLKRAYYLENIMKNICPCCCKQKVKYYKRNKKYVCQDCKKSWEDEGGYSRFLTLRLKKEKIK